MKVFQFYFNPKRRKGVLFRSFCYVPSSKSEEKLGSLYLVGNIKKDLAQILKNEYYSQPERGIEESFKQSLLKVRLKSDYSLTPDLLVVGLGRDFSAYFSKSSDTIKIFLLRDGEFFELGGEISDHPAKFSKAVSGQFIAGDRILVLNQELFTQFWENKIFQGFKNIQKPGELKKFLREKKALLRTFQGVLLFVFIKKERRKLYPKEYLPKTKLKSFSFKLGQKILPQSPVLRESFKKSLVKILILILLLLLGYFIFSA